MSFSPSLPVWSAEITVTTTDDELNADGDCSLREAISAANTDIAVDACPAGSGRDVIRLIPGDYNFSIGGVGEDANLTGDLDISSSMMIIGLSPDPLSTIINASMLDRVFHILPGASTGQEVRIHNLAIIGGSAVNSGGSNDDVGGGVKMDDPTGTLELDTVAIAENGATKGGGGLWNSGTTYLKNCSIVSNSVLLPTPDCSPLGNPIGGGGVFNACPLLSGPSRLVIMNCFFRENYAVNSCGGGLFNESSALGPGSSTTIINSTFSGNIAYLMGGGIFNSGLELKISQSTLFMNEIQGVPAANGAGIASILAPCTLKSTIIALNRVNIALPSDCSGATLSLGYNLDSDGSCLATAGPGDLVATDPMLIPVPDDNGTPLLSLPVTQTHAFASLSSPAVDHIPPAQCLDVDGNPVPVDQRRYMRPMQANPDFDARNCDIGAFEAEAHALLINEVDADTPGTDAAEFIELYDGGVGGTPLIGLTLVAFNGGTSTPDNTAYALSPLFDGIDLDTKATNGSGFFLLGNVAMTPDITFNDNQLQNGADAVALFVANGTDFTATTAVDALPFSSLRLDALVYDTSDADNNMLLLLTPGEQQIDESGSGASADNSNQRCFSGSGGNLITRTFFQSPPTAAALNCPPPIVPDGSFGTPMTAVKLDATGGKVDISWDTACIFGDDYSIIYGGGSQLPASLGGAYGVAGGTCFIGTTSPYTWEGSPDPSTDPSGFTWWVITANDRPDASSIESSWGLDAALGERSGPGLRGSSGVCAVAKDTSNECPNVP